MGFATQDNGENVAAEQEYGREPKETCHSIKFEATEIHSCIAIEEIIDTRLWRFAGCKS
jgi:hypothetical protein